MRIAIISDIPRNLEALKTMKEPYDELWVLGDLVNYGPNPGGVVDFVRSHATVVVRGNHDDAVGFNREPQCSQPFRNMARETMEFTMSVLSTDQITYLANLSLIVERTIGKKKFVLCHAAPSDPLHKYVPANSMDWEQEMKLVSADVLVVGHTHVPFVRSVQKGQVVNPGSLGQPKNGSTRARYAVWDDWAVLRSAEYDLTRTVHKIEDMPVSRGVRDDLKRVLLNGGLVSDTNVDRNS